MSEHLDHLNLTITDQFEFESMINKASEFIEVAEIFLDHTTHMNFYRITNDDNSILICDSRTYDNREIHNLEYLHSHKDSYTYESEYYIYDSEIACQEHLQSMIRAMMF